jgi:glycine cleavage system H protein
MSNYPENLRYSKSHEWFDSKTNKFGISEFAVGQLGDVVEVELPEVGDELEKGDEIGTIESVKTASPIYAPFSCKVLAVNEEIEDSPELVNDSPYDEGWIIEIEPLKDDEVNALMEFTAYAEHCVNEE